MQILPSNRIRSWLALGLAALSLILAAGVAPAGAAPLCTGGEDAPSACTPGPRPAPAPPASVSSTITIPSGQTSTIRVWSRSPVIPGLGNHGTTQYRVFLTCSNGFQRVGQFDYVPSGNPVDPPSVTWNFPRSTEPAGTCTVTTYDPVRLGVTKASFQQGPGQAGATQYTVYFE